MKRIILSLFLLFITSCEEKCEKWVWSEIEDAPEVICLEEEK